MQNSNSVLDLKNNYVIYNEDKEYKKRINVS